MGFDEHLEILMEDNHCIAVNKPVGWPSTHFDGSEETVDRLVKSHLKQKHQKPGNVFLGVVHRLDKPVSGVLLFARTSKSAARLSEQFREQAVEKIYWAVAQPTASAPPLPEFGIWEDWLRKNERERRIEMVDEGDDDAKPAALEFRKLSQHDGLTMLELRPRSGRRHQLRVQLASRGYPIYGDAKYGSPITFGPGIGLHARSLTFLHPIRYEPITLTAEVPKTWRGRFAYLLDGRR